MSNKKINPFDDIRAVIDGMPPIDTTCGDAVLTRLNSTVGGLKPVGRLDWSVARLANLQRTESPSIKKPMVAVFVGTHQIAESVLGVDLAVAAKERVENVTQGNAAVRGIARSIGAGFKIYEMGVEYPAANMSEKASLSERDCAAAIAFGMEAVAEGADVIVIGSSGLGSATAAAGIARGLYGGAAEYWAGGVGDRASKRIAAVEKASKLHKDLLNSPLDVLRCFGGRDIAGIVGAIIAARHQGIPVLLDGYVTCAAAAVLYAVNPKALDHCIAAHITTEPAHGALLDRIGMKPVLDFGIGIGDGSGAALTLGALKAATEGALDL